MSKINYDTGATVQMLNEGPDPSGVTRGGPVGSGTLAAAIRHVMAMSPEKRLRASIAADHDSGTERKWLKLADIEAIYARPDFPRDG